MSACDEIILTHFCEGSLHPWRGEKYLEFWKKKKKHLEYEDDRATQELGLQWHEFQCTFMFGGGLELPPPTDFSGAPRKLTPLPTTYMTPSCSAFSHTARVNDAASLGAGGEAKQLL